MLSKKREETAAQFIDRFLQFTTLGVFVLSFSYGVGAASYFMPVEMVATMDTVKIGLAVLGSAIVLPFFIKFVRYRKTCGKSFLDQSGFIIDVYRKACETAFAATFVFLIFLELVSGEIYPDLPAIVYVRAVLTVLLLSLSISFFFMSRSDDEEYDDFGGESA